MVVMLLVGKTGQHGQVAGGDHRQIVDAVAQRVVEGRFHQQLAVLQVVGVDEEAVGVVAADLYPPQVVYHDGHDAHGIEHVLPVAFDEPAYLSVGVQFDQFV